MPLFFIGDECRRRNSASSASTITSLFTSVCSSSKCHSYDRQPRTRRCSLCGSGRTLEWHLDLGNIVTMERMGSYPSCLDSGKKPDLSAIRRTLLRRFASRRKVRRSRGPFLKEFVKRKRFSFGRLRTASAGAQVHFQVGRWVQCFPRSVCCLVFGLRLGCSCFATGSCNRSFRTRLLPTHSFARYSLTLTVSSSAGLLPQADADLSSANSSP